jgi:hypothetical protein
MKASIWRMSIGVTSWLASRLDAQILASDFLLV